jgi:hypothetical protein
VTERAKPKPTEAAIAQALLRLGQVLDERGLLLMHDPALPSATQVVAGEPVPGSWWGQPSGALIYAALQRLDARPDGSRVGWVKLLGGKVTLVHERCWPALIRVARSRSPWQLAGLQADAKALLADLDAGQTLRSDQLELPAGSRKSGAVVTDLEARLLLVTEEEHTDRGHHARHLFSYAAWQTRVGIGEGQLPPLQEALDTLTDAAARSLGERALQRFLPWEGGSQARPTARTGVRSRRRDRP